MDPITQMVVGLTMQAVGYLFQPKPEKPKPPHMDDFEEPTSDTSRPVPALFGTVEITGLNALYSGDKSIDRRSVKIPSSKK